MVRQGRCGIGRQVSQAPQVEFVVVPSQAAGGVVTEASDTVERECTIVAAQRPGGRAGECSQVVEREPATRVLCKFGSDGTGDGGHLVEIEVPAMLRELSGHGERKAKNLVQIEMGGIVTDDSFSRVGG